MCVEPLSQVLPRFLAVFSSLLQAHVTTKDPERHALRCEENEVLVRHARKFVKSTRPSSSVGSDELAICCVVNTISCLAQKCVKRLRSPLSNRNDEFAICYSDYNELLSPEVRRKSEILIYQSETTIALSVMLLQSYNELLNGLSPT